MVHYPSLENRDGHRFIKLTYAFTFDLTKTPAITVSPHRLLRLNPDFVRFVLRSVMVQLCHDVLIHILGQLVEQHFIASNESSVLTGFNFVVLKARNIFYFYWFITHAHALVDRVVPIGCRKPTYVKSRNIRGFWKGLLNPFRTEHPTTFLRTRQFSSRWSAFAILLCAGFTATT